MVQPPTIQASAEAIHNLHAKLVDPSTSLPEKYRVMFSLRNVEGDLANKALLQALKDSSALFRHDVAFCLGQRQDKANMDVLARTLADPNEHAMVRHEAGEALGAIGQEQCLEALRQHLQDSVKEVAETCQLALQRIQYLKEHPDAMNEESPYFSVDPVPALPASTPTQELKSLLLDESKRMFDVSDGPGAGPHCTVRFLTTVLPDTAEHAKVRHEAAEALGAIASESTIQMLQDFAKDPEPIVAHSCEVALDMLEFEKSGSFQYAQVASA
ncbi:deoxyhypusine hydroxylase [Dunaliella salina]|uniref:Deoxyhypusine hydroxylase n=1 Tax=Dunaliella salina TaxID=3046 RepID=A0ABQ7H577_DUNSA|nr:deoxyhypusine hydroxylase [Dunaliella salina]|eukprot:KAF5842009.1 deoxyhypusine hydroxylase [Dunaliella salina]